MGAPSDGHMEQGMRQTGNDDPGMPDWDDDDFVAMQAEPMVKGTQLSLQLQGSLWYCTLS